MAGQRFTHITIAHQHIASRHCAAKPLAMAVKRALNLTDPSMQPRRVSAYSTFVNNQAYENCRDRAIQMLQQKKYQNMAQTLRNNPETALNIKVHTNKPVGYVVNKHRGKLSACTTHETRVVVAMDRNDPTRSSLRIISMYPVAEGHDLKPINVRDLAREVHNLPEYKTISQRNPLRAIALISSVDDKLPALAYDPKTKTLACPIEMQPGVYMDTLHFNTNRVYIAHNDGSTTHGAEAIKQNSDAMRVFTKVAPLIKQIKQTMTKAATRPTNPSFQPTSPTTSQLSL